MMYMLDCVRHMADTIATHDVLTSATLSVIWRTLFLQPTMYMLGRVRHMADTISAPDVLTTAILSVIWRTPFL